MDEVLRPGHSHDVIPLVAEFILKKQTKGFAPFRDKNLFHDFPLVLDVQTFPGSEGRINELKIGVKRNDPS
jgi:hypothetical protein